MYDLNTVNTKWDCLKRQSRLQLKESGHIVPGSGRKVSGSIAAVNIRSFFVAYSKNIDIENAKEIG